MEGLNWNEQCEILRHLSFQDWRSLEKSQIWKGFHTSQVPTYIIYQQLDKARRSRNANWHWENLKTYMYAKIYASRRRRRALQRLTTHT